jgi:TolB protein
MFFACLIAAAFASTPAEPVAVTQISDAYPAVSPDGKTLLFQSNRSGRWALYLADVEGSNVHLLFDSRDDPVVPSWSPDGSMIAYAATVDDQSEIFVMSADGSGSRRLTNDPGDDSHPHWSSDGRIFFNSARTTPDRNADWSDQRHEIFSMNAEGGEIIQHTTCRAVCTFGSPSPDGRMIAYRKVTRESGRNWSQAAIERNSEVFVANVDGSGERNISNDPAFDGWPVWTPDSKWVVFASGRDGVANSGQIYAASPDGSAVRKLTGGAWSNVQPTMAPNGRSLFTYRLLEGDGYEFGHIARYDIER